MANTGGHGFFYFVILKFLLLRLQFLGWREPNNATFDGFPIPQRILGKHVDRCWHGKSAANRCFAIWLKPFGTTHNGIHEVVWISVPLTKKNASSVVDPIRY